MANGRIYFADVTFHFAPNLEVSALLLNGPDHVARIDRSYFSISVYCGLSWHLQPREVFPRLQNEHVTRYCTLPPRHEPIMRLFPTASMMSLGVAG